MSYLSIVEMVGSQSLQSRVTAAVAKEKYKGDALEFTRTYIWQIVADGNWDAAWDSAVAGTTVNVNPDTGMRNDVITDGMILAVVQPLVQAANEAMEPPPPEPEPPTGLPS